MADPFAFLHPKSELDDLPPEDPSAAASSAKPKFQPKAKPRPQAKARPSKTQQQQPQQEKQKDKQAPVKDEPIKIETGIDDRLNSRPPADAASLQDTKPKVEPVDTKTPSVSSVSALKSDEEGDVDIKPLPVKKEEPESPPASPSFLSTEDRVVREIDVYLCPTINPDTQLYLLQYPLRPYWRPYGLEDRCDAVRVKPKQSKLELDLVIDTDGENYDKDAAEHLLIKKQTLSSSKTSLTTNYAVGLLRGNKLHLTPLHAIVQLRPSLKYLDEADIRKKQSKKMIDDKDEEMADAGDESEEEQDEKPQLVALKVEVKKQETERQEQMRLQSHAYLKQLDEAEAWIPLEPHGVDSPITDSIRHVMTSAAGSNISFGMSMSDYVNHLVPGRATSTSSDVAIQDASGDAGLSRSFLDTLPLEERFKKLLSKGRVHILQFDRLMKLAPAGCTEEEVLSVLQNWALLVQGCWVAASPLRHSGPICLLRDYMLSLFSKNRVISHEQLKELQAPREMIREVLVPLAVQRPAEGGWEFLESTDKSFLKRHQDIAKEHMERWADNEASIKDAAFSINFGATGSNIRAHNQSGATNVTGGALGRGNASASAAFSGAWTMSEETRAALPGALREIFSRHSVCSLNFLQQSLREMAITKASAPNANPKVVAAAVAAAKAPIAELTAAISQVASNIDGIYFLSKLGNPTLDPFRDVVIALLRARGASGGLRRQDIIEASKIALKAEVQPNIYQKVMKELCYTKGGAWVLKPGDGRPT